MALMQLGLRSVAAVNRVLGLVLCAAVLLAGCPDCGGNGDGGGDGGSDGGGDGGTGPEACETTGDSCIALGDWCETFATEECSRRVRCGMLDEARMAGCVRRLAGVCPQESIEHSVNSGRVQYWGTRARECVSRFVEAVGCGGSFTNTYIYGYEEDLFNEVLTADPVSMAVCRTVFEGRSEPGGACGQAIDCAPGSFCDLTSCPGQCVAYRKPGEPCDGRCGPDTVCLLDGNNQPVCQPRHELGEACECPLHRQDRQCGCQLELVCNAPPLSFAGQCVQASAAIGEACGTYGPGCVPGGYCKGGTCAPLEKQGVECSQGGNRCEEGLFCQNGSCTPKGSEGAACQFHSDGSTSLSRFSSIASWRMVGTML